MRILHSTLMIACCSLVLCCAKKREEPSHPAFTKADSLTEYYLALQDSLLHTWNLMINDDNQKIKTLRNLLHELEVTHPEEKARYTVLSDRIDQLNRLRYTQKSMANEDVVAEYDLATNMLIDELVSEAESKPQYSYNTTLQILVEQIGVAEERMINYRQEYDSIVFTYNRFLENNLQYLSETEEGATLRKKPLFQAVSEE
jgi:hypothetical protein